MQTRRPLVGLALGSGAARGLAHIGVLKALEKAKIPIDFLAGSSIGALVGAFYAAGMSVEMMEKLALAFDRKQWIDPVLPRSGLIKGYRIHEMIRLLTKNQQFADLKIPLAVVATDLRLGERVVFTEGNVADAVRASISVPGIFEPVRIGERILVDGGVTDRVPVSVLREMGAEKIIAVDVGSDVLRYAKAKSVSFLDVLLHSIEILENEAMKNKIIVADILIRPEVGGISPARFDQPEQCIRNGFVAVEEQLARIKELIGQEAISS